MRSPRWQGWPTQPEWLSLVAAPVRRGVDAGAPEDGQLQAVYDGLASARRTGGRLRAPRHDEP
ncbi:hypothetical protein Vau01_122390 [Virgisporangium aurantiacum]|uniref:Uncharacterized protein n=1 Tax=Virgisporangium aurantiacum TaxID=175570 RepID=A0A8J4E7Z5_9ACTN|nr:hypothetical protein Vau01_122390 [Virgisporangium aurantiacum]